MGNLGARGFQADFLHRDIELFAVFGFIDGLLCSTNHLDTVLGKYALGVEFQRAVQRCLTTHGREQGTRPLLLDNFGNGLPFHGLDVSRIGHSGVGHDGGGIRVHEDDSIAFLAKRLARLSTRVVKLTGLADNDRSSAEYQNALNVGSSWH